MHYSHHLAVAPLRRTSRQAVVRFFCRFYANFFLSFLGPHLYPHGLTYARCYISIQDFQYYLVLHSPASCWNCVKLSAYRISLDHRRVMVSSRIAIHSPDVTVSDLRAHMDIRV